MSLPLQADPIPLRMDEQGGIRVGDTRVLLELVIEAYRDGATPETIVRWFDSLELADVYAVISYYLKHMEEVEDYLRRRDELAAQVRRTIEAGQLSGPSFREELLACRARMEAEEFAGDRPHSLRSIFEEAHEQIENGGGIPHDQFWHEVEQARCAKRPLASRGKKG